MKTANIMKELLKFFIKPTSSTKKLLDLWKNEKYSIILVIIILNFLIIGISYISFWFFSNIITIFSELFYIIIFFLIGKFLSVKWNFLDVLFFTLLSWVISLFWILLSNLFLLVPIIISALWQLILFSKSLSKVWKISETKIVGIFVISLIIIYLISQYFLYPILGIKLF